MKQTIKFISSRAGGFLLVFVILFIIAGCTLDIIEWITNPQNIIVNSVAICIIFGFSVLSSWYFIKMLHIVEIHDEKIIFKGLFHKDIILIDQIQDIVRCNGRYKGTAYFVLKVEGYDSNKLLYPFQFDCNRKTQELVQKLWVDIQLRRSDE